MLVSKLVILRPNNGFLYFPLFSTTKHLFSSKPTSSTVSRSLLSTQTLSHTASHLQYGPSLHKGKTPAPQYPTKQNEGLHRDTDNDDDGLIDEDSFTRVFDIAALQVPAKDCFALENRLRGHLLNWPRIRNIARVPGDEIEEDNPIMSLINSHEGEKDSERSLDSLNRRVYGRADGDGDVLSPVLYRDKLAREFNSKGFIKFKHLAKLSRPSKKKRKAEEGGDDTKEGNGRRKFWEVEVVEERFEELKGLLGEGFKARRKWNGPTRLLLLDERHADKELDDSPEAIKAVTEEYNRENTTSKIELVRCRLTLFYDYWSMNEVLEVLLPEGMTIPSAFESVGHIAHLNLRDEHLPYKKIIAKVILDNNKPKIQTVVNKLEAIHNDYRTMQLEVLSGNRSLVTTVVENGLRFHFDLATVYWNSRLATERQRLLSDFTGNDIVCDVFSGVGPIAISAAKVVKRVYANDLNPYAVDYVERNCVLNKLNSRIKVFNMDGRRFIHAMFASEKDHSITQVVMNLPSDAAEYLDAFRGIYKDKLKIRDRTLPRIHVYGFSKARDPEFDFHERLRIALSEAAVDVEMRRVRLVAPGKWMLCASFVLPLSVACSQTRLEF